jgi:hypothetical protein
MNREDLHISSFVLAKNPSKDSVVLLRAGPNYAIPFKRSKLLLPARILSFGENPRHVAETLVPEQIAGIQKGIKVDFVTLQSYLGAHWDIVFLFETLIDSIDNLKPNLPFTELGLYKLSNLPTGEIAEDHLEVLDELKKEFPREGKTRS